MTSVDAPDWFDAVAGRDSARAGEFVFAVRTTGVFCRPGCGSRTPSRENVAFFESPKAALSAGYRPCKRCRPLDALGVCPPWVQDLFDALERAPSGLTSRELRARGLHPVAVARWFREHLGLSFQGFQRALRIGAAVDSLRAGERVSEAALASGFESESGFRDAFVRALGASPSRLAAGAQAVRLRRVATPLGDVLLGACDEGLCLLEFVAPETLPGQLAAVRKALGPALSLAGHEHLDSASAELSRYFAGELREFRTPLHTPGTRFEQAVWSALRKIEYGRTVSYAELARSLGRPSATRAVAGANSRNRIAIAIPCHRVVASDGGLGGYAGALWRKQKLLALEGAPGFAASTSRGAS